MLVKKRHTAINGLLTVAITLLLASAYSAEYFAAYAQSAQASATIVVSEEMRIDAGSEAPIGIGVRTGNAQPNQLLLLVRGLPAAISLSHGRLFESGVWALRIGDLPKLKIATQPDAAGNSELSLSLVGVDGTVLTQSHARLVIVPPHGGAAPDERTAANKDARDTAAPISHEQPKGSTDLTFSLPAPGAKPMTAEATEEALQLMAHGDENLKTGKIIVARKFYERAAENGWAAGALAVGRTYDPQELEKIGVIGGIKPDPKLAQTWYERAREMGGPEAGDRLKQIGNR